MEHITKKPISKKTNKQKQLDLLIKKNPFLESLMDAFELEIVENDPLTENPKTINHHEHQ